MNPAFIGHLRQNWPLALVVAGLLIYIPITLVQGVFYTNQGRIFRSSDPARYWRWIFLFTILLLASAAVLVVSFWLANPWAALTS